MKRLSSWLTSLFALLITSVPVSALPINWDAPPMPVPTLEVVNAEGELVGLDTLAGEVVVLNLWATWCAPCVRELPTLAALQARFEPGDLRVVALAIDRADFATLERFLADLGADNLHLLHSTDMSVARALGAQGLPLTIVIDRDGRERFRHAGYADWGAPAVVDALARLADE